MVSTQQVQITPLLPLQGYLLLNNRKLNLRKISFEFLSCLSPYFALFISQEEPQVWNEIILPIGW